MSFLASDVIQEAYQIANILSAQTDQSPTASQTTSALRSLNMLLDGLALTPIFSSFITSYDVIVTTKWLYIGENITSSDTDVTVLQSPFLNVILTASVMVANVRNYLEVHNLSALNQGYFVDVEGQPRYLFYDIEIDSSNNIFDKIFIQPAAVDQYTLTLRGIQSSQQFSDDTATVLATFPIYLTYELAFLLSNKWGKGSMWTTAKEEERKSLLETIVNNSPVDTVMNDTTSLLKKRGWFFTTTSGN